MIYPRIVLNGCSTGKSNARNGLDGSIGSKSISTDKVTAGGTVAQIALGLIGLDLLMDIRDLKYDLENWEWSWGSAGQTGLDAIGLIPIIGTLKYSDEAGTLIKDGLKGCNCFTAGTKVLTDEGEKPIEDIEVGDRVLAKNDETGEMAYKEVEWLFQRDVNETYNITVGGEVITTTDEHPFWIVGIGWVKSKDLKVGEVLTTSDGKDLAIEKIEIKKEQKTVYNFKVKDFHTYFVSNLGIWTHNACSIGTDFGKQGVLVENPGMKVDWGKPTKHGFDRMLERGVTSDMVNDWIRNGKALSQDGGKKFLYVTRDGAAVVANDGTLVTVMHKNDFDEKMQSMVDTLYGN